MTVANAATTTVTTAAVNTTPKTFAMTVISADSDARFQMVLLLVVFYYTTDTTVYATAITIPAIISATKTNII